MPRPKTDALIELSEWMEQAHQLQAALAALDERGAAFLPKGPKTPKKPASGARKRRAKNGAGAAGAKTK